MLKVILLKYRKLFGVPLPYEGTQLRLEGSVLDLDDAASDLIRDEALLEVSQIGKPLKFVPLASLLCFLLH